MRETKGEDEGETKDVGSGRRGGGFAEITSQRRGGQAACSRGAGRLLRSRVWYGETGREVERSKRSRGQATTTTDERGVAGGRPFIPIPCPALSYHVLPSTQHRLRYGYDRVQRRPSLALLGLEVHHDRLRYRNVQLGRCRLFR